MQSRGKRAADEERGGGGLGDRIVNPQPQSVSPTTDRRYNYSEPFY